jgi:hypothetical protein
MLKGLSLEEEVYSCDLCKSWKNVLCFNIEYYLDMDDETPLGEVYYSVLRLCKECIKVISLIEPIESPVNKIRIDIIKKIATKIVISQKPIRSCSSIVEQAPYKG